MEKFVYELLPGQGIKLFLEQETKKLFFKNVREKKPTSEWLDDLSHHASGLSKLLIAAEDGNGVVEDQQDNSYRLSYQFLSELAEHQASSLGLPPVVPYTMRVELSGPLTRKGTIIRAYWQDSIGRKVLADKDGSLLFVGQEVYRIPAPIYKTLKSLNQFNESSELEFDEKMKALSALKPIIGDSYDAIHLDERLQNIKLRHASAFSVDLNYKGDSLNIDPVLFSKETLNRLADEEYSPEIENQIFTPAESDKFLNECFNKYPDGKASYLLGKDDFVFIDPMLRESLNVVKQVQHSDESVKKRFAQSPASFISNHFESHNIEQPIEAVESLFIETSAFSERVLGLGLWVPPAMPVIPRLKNDWMPDELFLRVGNENVGLKPDNLQKIKGQLEEAISNENESIEVTGNDGQKVFLKADKNSVDAVNQLIDFVKSYDIPEPTDKHVEPEEPDAPAPEADELTDKQVLLSEDNIDETHFTKNLQKRASFEGFESIDSLKNELRKHQVTGVSWLQEAWSKGYPGVLLADDMGLGKTFQTLAFLGWLKQKKSLLGKSNTPILIVAPVSLLENWRKEANMHLEEGVLGDPLLLYGKNLSLYRSAKSPSKGNDVSCGGAVLDMQRVLQSAWILTNYETMRDYHISLASIKFSAIIFDEMQKVKNPTSAMTNASKALNSEFMIGLTGTPIENSMADLWTILDTLLPGALGMVSLKEFVKKYNVDDIDALKNLRKQMMESSGDNPAPILRRMKSDIADDLPVKREQRIEVDMPQAQEWQYSELIKLGKARKISGLELVSKLKMASIHPVRVTEPQAEESENYIQQSAKYQALIEILDKAHANAEKVLVFIEFKDIHEWLSVYIKQRYKMDHYPKRIFGDVDAQKRMAIVDKFQEKNNQFDVLLLSPKAAGVGLTLTEATIVIHFTRWWNPAVEDQCTDRAYRIGQTKDVTVYYPMARHPVLNQGSFDYILDKILSSKRELSKEFLVPVLRKDDAARIEAELIKDGAVLNT
ncbi:DEAD/DEAH box helicase [Thiomicrorhabdus sp. Milos-T2]|uniref:DEAD/DEAH box helicase n=1 Tax=Thiomicrorhabdus sp. Milos-T2 TaxID=90814 RepID=UPI00049415C0|nr:DEAD/DEAH box helicase [Thiomicrorhabdus sp. Milos-T2]